MQNSLQNQFKTIFALTSTSPVAVMAASFGINMVFRFLKFGSGLRKVYEEQRKGFDEKVRSEGVVLMPVHIRAKSTLVETYFMSGMAKRASPEVYNSMKKEIELYKTGNFAQRRAALKTLEVAYFLLNEGKNWRENKTLMDLANASIRPKDEIQFREMVDILEPLYGKEFIGFDDFDELVDEYAKQELQALNFNLNKMQSESIGELRNTVKQMFWDTMQNGDDNTIQTTLSFIVAQKILTQRKKLESIEREIRESDDVENTTLLEKKKEAINESIQALEEVNS
jgi:hypothetical protein